MPGTRVAIGLNSPRISRGAAGFISPKSVWLGPPKRNTKMHERIRPAGAVSVGAAARSRARSTLLNPSRLSPPTRNSSRREHAAPPSAAASKIENIHPPPRDREPRVSPLKFALQASLSVI